MSVKDQVLELVNKFKKENYLKNKTDAMGEGLLLGANLADEANERSKDAADTTLAVQEKYKEQILAQDLNPNKDPELVDLRNGNTTAGERITKFEQQTDDLFAKNDNKIDKINNTVYLEDNDRLIPETTSGWLSRVINSAGFGTVKTKSKKTYYIQSPIKITASDVIIDFNGAVLASQGPVTNQFEIENVHNVTIKNLFTTKTETDAGGFLKATNVTDLTLKDVKGSLTGFDSVLLLRGVSRAKFQNINIKNSNATRKGIGIQMDYCVNIDYRTTFLEYFNISVLLTATKSEGTIGYMNEGINFDGLFCIKQNVGIQCHQCTQLNLSNIILDFCASYAIYVPNVNGMTVSQYWLGLQDGGVTGFELIKGLSVFMKMGTVVGDWTKQATQKAFYSAVDTPMTVDGVYMIDIHGGNLDRSKIEVNGDYYYQSAQKAIVRSEYGTSVQIFDGQTSSSNPFAKSNMSFSIYSFDQNNKLNFIKSEGYVDYTGNTHINKVSSGGTGSSITHVLSGSYNTKLESTYSMTAYKTIINRFIPKPSRNVMEI